MYHSRGSVVFFFLYFGHPERRGSKSEKAQHEATQTWPRKNPGTSIAWRHLEDPKTALLVIQVQTHLSIGRFNISMILRATPKKISQNELTNGRPSQRPEKNGFWSSTRLEELWAPTYNWFLGPQSCIGTFNCFKQSLAFKEELAPPQKKNNNR